MPSTVALALLPATSSTDADVDSAAPSPVITLSAGHVPAMPDNSSVHVQWIVTSPVYQPFPFGGVVGAPLMVGAVLSMLIGPTVVLAALPAASFAVPVADWFRAFAERRRAAAADDARERVVASERHRDVVVVPAGGVRPAVGATADRRQRLVELHASPGPSPGSRRCPSRHRSRRGRPSVVDRLRRGARRDTREVRLVRARRTSR